MLDKKLSTRLRDWLDSKYPKDASAYRHTHGAFRIAIPACMSITNTSRLSPLCHDTIAKAGTLLTLSLSLARSLHGDSIPRPHLRQQLDLLFARLTFSTQARQYKPTNTQRGGDLAEPKINNHQGLTFSSVIVVVLLLLLVAIHPINQSSTHPPITCSNTLGSVPKSLWEADRSFT